MTTLKGAAFFRKFLDFVDVEIEENSVTFYLHIVGIRQQPKVPCPGHNLCEIHELPLREEKGSARVGMSPKRGFFLLKLSTTQGTVTLFL